MKKLTKSNFELGITFGLDLETISDSIELFFAEAEILNENQTT